MSNHKAICDTFIRESGHVFPCQSEMELILLHSFGYPDGVNKIIADFMFIMPDVLYRTSVVGSKHHRLKYFDEYDIEEEYRSNGFYTGYESERHEIIERIDSDPSKWNFYLGVKVFKQTRYKWYITIHGPCLSSSQSTTSLWYGFNEQPTDSPEKPVFDLKEIDDGTIWPLKSRFDVDKTSDNRLNGIRKDGIVVGARVVINDKTYKKKPELYTDNIVTQLHGSLIETVDRHGVSCWINDWDDDYEIRLFTVFDVFNLSKPSMFRGFMDDRIMILLTLEDVSVLSSVSHDYNTWFKEKLKSTPIPNLNKKQNITLHISSHRVCDCDLCRTPSGKSSSSSSCGSLK